MKILYISEAAGADYMCDMAFHGLRSILGPDCVDVNKLTFMYQGTPHPPFYTVYANLPDIEVDRTDIPAKIRNHYFDAVIYGSVHRCRNYFDEVKAAYPVNRIAFMDGEDDIGIAPVDGMGIYFKRELADGMPFRPIEFCIPREKVRSPKQNKSRLMALCDPRDRSTYIYYTSESDYYDQYSRSYFGYTMKKGGWDCCRHYEIMAAGCLPYFANLESCPQMTLAWLPKDDLMKARKLHDEWNDSRHDEWQELMNHVNQVLLTYLTTDAMAYHLIRQVSA